MQGNAWDLAGGWRSFRGGKLLCGLLEVIGKEVGVISGNSQVRNEN